MKRNKNINEFRNSFLIEAAYECTDEPENCVKGT